jgi:hypothetical protein
VAVRPEIGVLLGAFENGNTFGDNNNIRYKGARISRMQQSALAWQRGSKTEILTDIEARPKSCRCVQVSAEERLGTGQALEAQGSSLGIVCGH